MNAKRFITSCLALVAIYLLLRGAGCSSPTRAELIGKYCCTYPFGSEVLDLESDGLVKQTFTKAGVAPTVQTGTWKFQNGELVLRNIYIYENGAGLASPRPQLGVWAMSVSKSFTGRLRLQVNQDLDLYFEKSSAQ
jgi:hypothetical protein